MRLILILFFAVGSYFLCAQSRLSPKFNAIVGRAGNSSVTISISFFNLKVFVEKYNSRVQLLHYYKQSNTMIVQADHDIVLHEFANDKNIIFIDIVNAPGAEGFADNFNNAFNKINKVHNEFPLLNGQDRKVLIKEQQFDTASIDLRGRFFKTTLEAPSSSQHATTIATIIAGGGNSSEKAEGVATKATLGSTDFSNLLPDPDDIFSNEDVHLENHSYGVDVENYYGNEAAAYDQQVYNNPTLIHIFSAGNLGLSIPAQGTYAGLPLANLSGNFKQAKNIITVTAVDTTFKVNDRNSRGPAYDGRIKPELVAFGQDGTSDAAALVTGICALLQQRYNELNNAIPSMAEMKSILIASADDLEHNGVDFTSGYGSVNAYRAISLLNKGSITTRTINKGNDITIPIQVPPLTHQLIVAVTWVDPPALQNSSTALVNDIDAVLSKGAEQYEPWVLNSTPDLNALKDHAVRKPDHLNTVEYFTLDNPGEGLYTLTLKAQNIASPSQSVSIAYWLEEAKTFTWNYPVHTDKLEANKKAALMWEIQDAKTGTLSLQLNSGEWRIINTNVNLDSIFKWNTPDTLSLARLKMTIGATDYLSDTFLISQQPSLNVAFNCDTQFALTWSPVAGATSYGVYGMNTNSLELITTVNDTMAILNKNANDYFTIAANLNGATGIKAQTINYEEQGTFCYINFFDAERFDESRITIQLNLSSIIDVNQVIIYKILKDNNKVPLVNIDSNGLTGDNLFYDTDFSSGVLHYQAEVVLANGLHITSEIRSVYIEQKGKAILFPNPVQNEINILSEEGGLSIKIINMMGQTVYSQELKSVIDTISTIQFAQGMYLLELLRDSKTIDIQKFIKI